MQDGMMINLMDDDGSTFDLEVVGSLAYQDEEYVVFLPVDMDEDDPEYGFIILQSTEEDGEETFHSVDDDDLLATLYEMYMQQLEDLD